MRPEPCLLIGALLLGGCAQTVPPTNPAQPVKSTAQLLNTYWKLTQLGDQVITTPEGAREIQMVMHSENQRVAGFSGCNRMMGSYVLNGDELRFAQMAGTMMACVSGMDVEKKFLAMFNQVARWEISGENLRLLDVDGKTLATFESRYM
jgi:heat shock protein HslJ